MPFLGWPVVSRFSIISVVLSVGWTFQVRFVAPFLREYGINKEEVGALIAAGCAIAMISHPLLAAVCDFTSIRPRTVLFWWCFAAMTAMPIHLVPWFVQDNLLAWLLLARLTISFFWIPIGTVLDTIFIYSLTTDEYGVIRVWSAATLAVWQPLILGPLLDQFGYWIMVPGFVSVAAVLCFSFLVLIDDSEQQYKEITKEQCESAKIETWLEDIKAYMRKIGQILWAEEWLSVVFYWTLFIMGAVTALVEFLVFLFWIEELGASNSLCGLSITVAVLLEIPLFYYSGSLLRIFSLPSLLIFSGLAYAIRVVAYTLIDNPWFVLLFEPLHGVTYAFYRLSIVYYAKRVAPEGLRATAQSFGWSLRDLGRVVATLVGGSVMEHYGSVVLYRGAAAITLFSMVLLGLVLLLHPQYHDVLSPTSDEERPDASDADASEGYQAATSPSRKGLDALLLRLFSACPKAPPSLLLPSLFIPFSALAITFLTPCTGTEAEGQGQRSGRSGELEEELKPEQVDASCHTR